MVRTIAALGTVMVLTSLPSIAQAQSKPMGSAASLDGLQERSVQRSTPTAPVASSPQSSTDVPGGTETGFQLNNKVQLIVRPERGTSQVGVFPADDTSEGNKFQVQYQIDQQ